MFAYINEGDCFGTLIEIGWAQALNKYYVVGLGPDAAYDEMWMARENAAAVLRGTPTACWDAFARWVRP